MSNLIVLTNFVLVILVIYQGNKDSIGTLKFNLTRWLIDHPNAKAPLDFSIAHQILMSKLKFWQLNDDPTVDKMVVYEFKQTWNQTVKEYVLGNAHNAQLNQTIMPEKGNTFH